MSGPVTLGDLVREDKLLWVYCCDCGHERDVDPLSLPLPPEERAAAEELEFKSAGTGSDKNELRPQVQHLRPRGRQCPASTAVIATVAYCATGISRMKSSDNARCSGECEHRRKDQGLHG